MILRSVVLILLLLSTGCATGVVSKEFKTKAGTKPNVNALLSSPEKYVGNRVILGGIVLGLSEAEGGTYIDVLEKQLDYWERPLPDGESRGRFVIFNPAPLDISLYPIGSEITVAGEVKGKISLKIDDSQLELPLIQREELHGFKPRSRVNVRFGFGIFHTIE